jgi:hypothetical protein
MAGMLLAFDLGRLDRNPDYRERLLEDALNSAPRYGRFADAGKHIIRTIHALPHLWEDASLSEVEVYIGRAGATPRHLFNRWKAHLGGKRHQHGVVVLKCDTDLVEAWETAAVRTLRSLDRHGRLCVKNASASGQGTLPGEPECCIYLTWAMTKQRRIDPADRHVVDEVAREVAEATRFLEPPITLQHMQRAIDPITRPIHERGDVMWHPHHDED